MFFLIGAILCLMFVRCNKSNSPIKINVLDKDKCYLVFRGTNTKEGIIAEEFNLFNTKSSHVGICVFQNSKWTVYHVLNPKVEDDTALIREGFDDFFDIDEVSLFSASIWVLKDLSTEEFSKLLKKLRDYEQLKLKFDLTFASNDPTKLYCSEFVCNVLKKVNKEKFSFSPSKIKLKGLHSLFLGKDSLEYYPVDIFQCNQNIELVKEWSFQSLNAH